MAKTAAADLVDDASFVRIVEVRLKAVIGTYTADAGDSDGDDGGGRAAKHEADQGEENNAFAWGSGVLEVNERLEGRDGPGMGENRYLEATGDHDGRDWNVRVDEQRDMGLGVDDDVHPVGSWNGRDEGLDLSEVASR